MEKRCFKCGEIKPLSAFYRHPQMGDGHLNKCKECNKMDVRENRANKVEYYRNYDRLRYDEQGMRSELQPLEKQREYKRAWSERNKEKRRAQTLARKALKSGVLVKQPCEECGETEGVEAHHEDYSKPLDVTWLCTYHHGLTRRKPRVGTPYTKIDKAA